MAFEQIDLGRTADDDRRVEDDVFEAPLGQACERAGEKAPDLSPANSSR